MRIGYLTDIHLRVETPEGRTDNFNQSILNKLEESGQIFQEENCDIILCGGDWGDRPDVPYSVCNDLIGVVKDWNKPVYGIIGSHDYYGYQIKSLKRTAIGAIYKAGLIELIGSPGMKEFVELEDVCICGTPHTYWLDDDVKNYYKEKYTDKYQIQLTHGMLLDKPAIFQYTLIKDVKTESELLLAAHYHPGWNKLYYTYGNTTFAHPGGLARIDNTGNIRIPKVMIIDTKINKIYTRELTTAIPHPFKEKIKESKENTSMNLMNKVMSLLEDTKVQTIDIKTQIPIVAQELNFGEDIINEAFNLIEEAERE